MPCHLCRSLLGRTAGYDTLVEFIAVGGRDFQKVKGGEEDLLQLGTV
jgi:hypothetical protein